MNKRFMLLIAMAILICNVFITRYLIRSSNYIPHASVMENLNIVSSGIVPDSSALEKQKLTIQESITQSRTNAITRAINVICPSVVSVNVIKREVVQNAYGHSLFDEFFWGFLPRRSIRQVQSIGSGVIISADGYIITNSHVVKNATAVKVILCDGKSVDARIVGNDDVNDIAVLKITGSNLPYAVLGNSDDIIIGEWVIASGNPFGFLIKDSKPTVTVGVVSATDRNFHVNEDNRIYKKMIQSDAAINPGNSGGPLVNIYGEVIGINTFIFTKSGGSLGIGFAIPINRVKSIAKEIIQHGKIRPIWFGFKVQDITPSIAYSLGLSSTDGVLVSSVDKKGPADKAGLHRGDIIIALNDQVVHSVDDAEMVVADVRVGSSLTMSILRDNEKQQLTLVTREYQNRRGSFFKL